ncbi:MAG: uracil-DNA glycosylase [Ruminococcaceae bacterium]|nr:uracil-DNA glycosylase [Oscillospiraceae bacterium]
MVKFENDWDEILLGEFEKEYYLKLRDFLKKEYSQRIIYPSMYDIFNALKWTSYKDTKVVIIGQDPYHGEGQAHGLAFSVKKGIAIPPSLVNIYKELNKSLGCYIPNNGYLEKWARQGVLLLNASLTVRKDMANSHSDIGWQIFTDNVIKLLNERNEPVIFLLWGSFAAKKALFIDKSKHYVLTTTHPSPLSAHRGFLGCNHFKTVNEILVKNNKEPIDWQIENI